MATGQQETEDKSILLYFFIVPMAIPIAVLTGLYQLIFH
jgi:hypothetical protein